MGNILSRRLGAVVHFNEDEGAELMGTAVGGQLMSFATSSKSMFAFKYACGQGRFGLVWKVIKKSNKVDYAIKIMDKTAVYNHRSVDCVLNELKLLSKLRNPFIVNAHYAFQEKEQLFLVSRFMSGGDLRYHMDLRKKTKRPFSEDEARFIIACMIAALEYLHSNGVIHRDVCPENIFLNS